MLKRILKILRNTLIVLILMAGAAYLAIQTKPVQTWLSQRIAAYMSKELGARVEIGGVYIDLWARVEIQDLLIADQKDDTLLFAPSLRVNDYRYDSKTGEIDIQSATLQNPFFNIIRHEGDTVLNYVFILDYIDSFSSPEDTSHTLLHFRELEIADGRLNYINENREIRDHFGIDWNHIQANQLNVDINDFAIVGDSIHASINELSLREKSGFQLQGMTSEIMMTPGHLRMDQSNILTERSEIKGDLSFKFESIDDFDLFEEKVRMNHTLVDTKLYMADLAYFSDDLLGWDKEVMISGKFKGKISSLKGRDVKIVIDENTRFSGSFGMDGLPEIDQTFITMDIDELTTNKKELDRLQIPPFDTLTFLKTPDNFAQLGQITYSGNFTGFINDFASIGKIKTAIGNVETDIALRFDERINDYVYRGNLATNGFDLGKFYSSSDMGPMSCNLFVDGRSLELKKMNANFKGDIYSVSLNGYNYTNIKVKEGKFALRQFNGDFSIDDPNATIDFNGSVDFRPADPLLNFTAFIHNLNLKELGILPKYNYSSISGRLDVTSEGFDIEKFVGEIKLQDITYCVNESDYYIGDLVLTSTRRGEPVITLNSSDLAYMRIQGDFNVDEVMHSLTEILSQIVPNMEVPVHEHKVQKFDLELVIYDAKQITEVFVPELVIAPNTRLNLHVDEPQNTFEIDIISKGISYQEHKMAGLVIAADRKSSNEDLYLNLKADTAFVSNLEFTPLSIDAYSEVDTVKTSIEWGIDSITSHAGEINGRFVVHSFDSFDFTAEQSSVTVKGEKWYLRKGTYISMDKREIQVSNLQLSNGEQWVKADGGISENPAIPLRIEMHEFDIGNLNAFIQSDTKFYGIMGGTASIRDAYNNLIFSNDITLRDFTLNDYYVGYLCVQSSWDNQKGQLRIDGTLEKDLVSDFQLTRLTPLKFNGYYTPSDEKSPLDLVATVQELDLAFINEFLSPGVIDIRGYVSGTLAITGKPDAPQMEGEAYLKDASIYVNYLNVRYYIEKEMGIMPDMFTFDNIVIRDQESNPGHLTGTIMHNNFSEWNFDLGIEMDPEVPMLAMNTTELLNPSLFGKAYTTGFVGISGFEDQLAFECNIKSEKGTTLSMPMGNTEEQSFENFVRFVDAKSKPQKLKNDLSGITLNLNMEITPDAEFQIVFDAGAGDIIRGRGKGHILMDISGSSTFNMYGLVEVTEGDYLFTLQNLLVNKHFTIDPGGTIAWYGDPFAAELNLRAVYTVSASLYDIVPDPRYAGGQRVPVELKMHLTGKMLDPMIEFDIDLPTVDQVTRSRVNSIISTDQERNRQAFSLLVLRRFVSPPNVSSDHQSTNVVSATGSELLSSQVSNWLSQLSNDFDLGFNYRPGDDITNEEIALALSTQLFNDKVSLSTNVGVSRNTSSISQNPNNLIGDVRIEYRVDDNGKVKLVVYNESSDFRMATTQQSPYTQGVGILYQEEFDTMDELFERFRVWLKGTPKAD